MNKMMNERVQGTQEVQSWQSSVAIFAASLAGFAMPVSTALLNVAVALLVLIFLMAPSGWRSLRQVVAQPFVAACLCFYAVLLIGTSYSPVGAGGAAKMLLKVREYLFAPVFFALFLHVKNRKALFYGFAVGALLSVLVSIGVAVAGIGAVDKINALFGHRILQASAGDWAAFRTHIAHNFFVSLFALGLFVLLLTDTIMPKWRKWAWLALAASLIDVLFLVEGRTAQFSLVLVCGLIFVLWKRRLGLVLGLCVVLVLPPVLYFGSTAVRAGIDRIGSDVGQYKQGQVDTSIGLRLDFYKNSWSLIQEKPWIGHGTGSFASEYRRFTGYVSGNVATTNPHNDYFWYGVEQGVLGIAALLGMVVAALFQGRQRGRAEHWLVVALVSSMVLGAFVNSFFTDQSSRITFVLLACALLAGDSFAQRRA